MSTKTRMRIFIIEPRGSGGMIHYAYQLCNALSDHVTEVTLVTARNYELVDYPHKFRVDKLLNLWNRTNTYPVVKSHNKILMSGNILYRNVRRVFRGIRLFLEWIKLTIYLLKARPDIIQFGEIEFPFEAGFLHYLRGKGLLLTQICHEFEPRERHNRLSVRIENRLLGHVFSAFSVIFFHSMLNQVRFHEIYPSIPVERFHLISMGNGSIFPNSGNDSNIMEALKMRYGVKSTDLIVLFFGNITTSKGIPDLISAFAKVHAQNNQARLLITGMPLKYIDVHTLLDAASGLGIQSVTHFDFRYLPIEEVAPLMSLATVVVFPYLSGTQSASIQAAYACGKPVIATRVGGLPDVVEDEKSGFLVKPNCPDELSEAILKIVNDPELTKRMSSYAKQLSKTRFAWDSIAGKIVSIYRLLM